MISIIIPTFNEEKVIESTLCTLASTLTLPHEVIVSDGGSSDRTVELAAKYAAAVVVFSGPGRQTIAQGQNDGAKTARGDFFIFLDADCIIPEPDGSLPKRFRNFGSILTWSRSPPSCACSQRRRLSATSSYVALPTSACGSKTIYSTAASRLENFR